MALNSSGTALPTGNCASKTVWHFVKPHMNWKERSDSGHTLGTVVNVCAVGTHTVLAVVCSSLSEIYCSPTELLNRF